MKDEVLKKQILILNSRSLNRVQNSCERKNAGETILVKGLDLLKDTLIRSIKNLGFLPVVQLGNGSG